MKARQYRSGAGRISSFSTMVGITLVLTMVGVLLIVLQIGRALTHHFREQLTVQVLLHEGAEEAEVLRLQRHIEGRAYAGAVSYTSPEEASRIMQAELGEEFVDFLGYNPLPASLDIHVDPEFTALDSLPDYLADVASHPAVAEVVYQKGLLQQVHENITKWGMVLTLVGVIFLVIAVVLIVNTIELAIFSQRLLIRSMQLVGATSWFIQRPFLRKGLQYGLTGALLAMALLSAGLYAFREDLKDVIEILIQKRQHLVIAGALLLLGVAVSLLATAYAVRRFIRLRLDQLY